MDDETIDALAAAFGGGEPEFPEGHHGFKLNLDWRPKLNPVQTRAYDCRAPYVLEYGPRGSGKTQGALHALVRHAVNNRNAYCAIVTRETGQATEGGAYESLITDILPQWKRGNFDRKTGRFIDAGCGIDYTSSKLDPLDKKPRIFVTNKFGGWSCIKLLSLFVGHAVEDKVKGKVFSFVMCDEAQTFETPDYLTKLGQQVGRRQGITDQQQIYYCCNPKGPSHWLYNSFFCLGTDEEGKPVEWPIDEETGYPIDPVTRQANKNFAIFFVPTVENLHNLPDGYWDRVMLACKNDPIEYQRMVQGLWVDKPEGDALFKDEWNDALHLLGDYVKNVGVIPAAGYPLVISWDPGAAHTSVHFQQFGRIKDKIVWVVIDELNCVGRYTPYVKLVPNLIKRMQYWEGLASKKEGKDVKLQFVHISDSSAFNQFRAKDGSFDAQDIENISREYVTAHNLDERFIIRMRACPKGPHSIEARVRIEKDMLATESLVVSATCAGTRAMFMHLEEDRDARMKPKRSKHIHVFDSLTYAHLYYNSGAGRAVAKPVEDPVRREFYAIGRG